MKQQKLKMSQKRQSKSLAEATREVLQEHPEIEYYLARGWLNYRAMARSVLKEVEAKTGLKAKVDSVATALRRCRELSWRRIDERGITKILAGSRLHLMSKVAVVTFKRSWELARELGEISRKVSEEGGLVSFVQNPFNMIFVVDEHQLDRILSVGKRRDILEVRRNLSALIMVSPREITETPGVIAKVTGKLGREGINLAELISSHNVTMFLVEKNEAQRAYEIINTMIEEAGRIG
jgi:aspartokinase